MGSGSLLALFILATGLAAPDPAFTGVGFPGSYLAEPDGLSNGVVHAIHQGRRGFLWIATEHGLNRYDGAEFTVYEPRPGDGRSLPAAWVDSILEDREGFLWLGIYLSGVARFDPVTGNASHLFPSGMDASSPPSGRTTAFLEDQSGRVWIGTDGGWTARFDPASGVFDVRAPVPGEAPVLVLAEDAAGTIWIGTERGLFRLDPGEPAPRPCTGPGFPGANTWVTAIETTPEGRLLVAGEQGLISIPSVATGPGSVVATTPGAAPAHGPREAATARLVSEPVLRVLHPSEGDSERWLALAAGGLLELGPGSSIRRRFPPGPGPAPERGLPVVPVTVLHRDPFGVTWAGTPGGLYRLAPDDSAFQRVRDPRVEGREETPAITCLEVDRSGILWFGTHGGGLLKVDPRHHRFHPQTVPGPDGPLSVLSIARNGRGTTWAGTAGGGVRVLDDGAARFGAWAAVPGTAPGWITALLPHRDDPDLVWAGTLTGLLLVDRHAGRMEFADPADTGAHVLRTAAVRTLVHDESGRLWVGTSGQGVLRLDTDGTVTRFPLDTDDPAGIPDGEVLALCAGKQGAMWLSSIPSGLLRFDPVGGVFERHFDRGYPADGRTMPRSIQAIHPDRSGALWLGTYSDGLARYDPATGEVRYVSRADGLPSNWILSILEDGPGGLWLGTDRGLCRYDPGSGAVRRFEPSDGLQGLRFAANARWKDRTGELLFGGPGGLNRFHPDSLAVDPHVPPVVLTGFRIHAADGDRAVADILGRERIDLDPDENFFTVRFAALHFGAPGRNRYAYRLEGLDREWMDSGTRNLAIYTGVPPGDYTLRVRASNGDGVWNETGTSLAIVVHPPFWRTDLFAASCAIAVLALGVLLYRMRLRAVEQRALTLERVRQAENERVRRAAASDFHDELGHLVTRISLFAEILRRRTPPGEETSAYAARILATAKRLSGGMGDFLWTLDPDRDSLREVVVRLKDFGDHVFDGTGVSFGVDGLDEDLEEFRLPALWRRHLTLFVKEALTNALKHAGSSSVRLEVVRADRVLELAVVDDGRGLPEAGTKEGHGLRSMRSRAAALGGRLVLEDAPGRGTRVAFRGSLPGNPPPRRPSGHQPPPGGDET